MAKDMVSEVRVLSSAAGYYIGYQYWNKLAGAWFPWSRQSKYMEIGQARETLPGYIVDTHYGSDKEKRALLDYHRGLEDVVISVISEGCFDE
jgi:hypothetical protein